MKQLVLPHGSAKLPVFHFCTCGDVGVEDDQREGMQSRHSAV
jgi:hypothetical protein